MQLISPRRLPLRAWLTALLGLGLIALSPGNAFADSITIGGPSDCDNNAIIRCGVHSTAALMSAYQSDPYTQAVFRHFSISQADMNNLMINNVAGRVTRTGKVYINSQAQAVATGAMTGGRQNMPGSTKVNTKSGIFFMRPPSVSFQESSLPAFVSMKNGQFQFAIIASCGNAVSATPKPAPQPTPVPVPAPAAPVTPAPMPTPTQTQSQNQSQTQTVVVQTTPAVTPTPAPVPAPAQAGTVTPAKTLVNTGSSLALPVLSAMSAFGLGYYCFRKWMFSRLL
jgi:hypothetical protein